MTVLAREANVLSKNWQPLNMEHYDSLRTLASEVHAYAPDARVLTTYYTGIRFSILFINLFIYQCMSG